MARQRRRPTTQPARKWARVDVPPLRARLFSLVAAVLLVLTSFAGIELAQPEPAAANHTNIKMPFPSGAAWTIGQGYNTRPTEGGSHWNCNPNTLLDEPTGTRTCRAPYQYKWSFDLARADGNTAGQPVLSSVNGTIRWIDQSTGGMSIDLGDGYAYAFFHADLASGLAPGQTVTQGQQLGVVSPPGGGGNGGWPHLHVTLWQTTDGGNWSRNAVPFTGSHKLDGYDFPALAESNRNQYRGQTIYSTNTPLGSSGSGAVPAAPVLQSPATGTTFRTANARPTLTWNAVPGATEYQVVLNDTTFSPWVSGTSWTTDPLGRNQWAWQVRARNSNGVGNFSPKWVFWVDPPDDSSQPPPPPPGSLGLGLSAASGGVGTSTTASATGFGANETVRFYWDSTSTTPLTSVTANSSGSAAASLTIPEAVRGSHTVIARGASTGRQATRAFTVVPTLARTPYQATPGTAIAVTVRGFAANESVRLNWQTATGPVLGTAQTNSRGTGNVTITLPSGPPGWNDYTGVGLSSGARAWGAINVLSNFTANPTSGSPGTTVNASASGFPTNRSITVAWNRTGSSAGTTVCSGTTTATGTYSCSFQIPSSGAGSYPLVATTSDGTSRSVNISVAGSPTVSLNPTSGPVGTNLSINIGGFQANETVNLTWDNNTSVWTSRTASSAGAVSIQATVPSLSVGNHTLRVRGVTSGRTATANFNVTQTGAGGGGSSMIAPGTYAITATREGLVGYTTSNGHVIVEHDEFVALPACTNSNCPWLASGQRHSVWGLRTECGDNCYVKVVNPANNSCEVAPVWDVGPWFTIDDWWNPTNVRNLNNWPSTVNILTQGYTGADAARNGVDVGFGVSSRGIGISNRGYETGNRAAMDIADGTWLNLGFPFAQGSAQVVVTLLWQTGEHHTSAAAGCGNGGGSQPPPPPPPPPTASISLSTGVGQVGTETTITGSGFSANETVRIFWDSTSGSPLRSVQANSSGNISVTLPVPEATYGNHTLIARGVSSNRQANATFGIRPSLARTPSQGTPGTSVSVTARGFGANETVRLNWQTATGPVLATTQTNASGTANVTISIPQAPAGWHDYAGTGLTSGARAWGAIQVLSTPPPPPPPSADVTRSPSAGVVGTQVTLNATGFAAGERVTAFWGTNTVGSGSANANSSGAATFTTTVPTLPYGSHPITVRGMTSGRTASASFMVASRLQLSPTSGPEGTRITVTGTGFDESRVVNIYWNRTSTNPGTRVCIVTTTSSGTFSCSFSSRAGSVGVSYPITAVSGTRQVLSYFRVTTGETFSAQTTDESAVLAATDDQETVEQEPTETPTEVPTNTPEPTETPTAEPTESPTEAPTNTPEPTETPTEEPTETPDVEEASEPSESPESTETPEPTTTAEPTATTESDETVVERPTRPPRPTREPRDRATPVDAVEEPTATPTEEPTATPTETPADDFNAEVIEEEAPVEEPIIEEQDPVVEPEPVAREVVLFAAADTSVSAVEPDQPQSPELIGSLPAGGANGAIAFLTFHVQGIAAGTVVDAKLVLTGAGEAGGPGGIVGVLPGSWGDGWGMADFINLAYGAPPALTGDGAAAYLHWIEPWSQVVVDVTGTVAADGTITFVIVGSPDAPIAIASLESGAPPYLILTVIDQ